MAYGTLFMAQSLCNDFQQVGLALVLVFNDMQMPCRDGEYAQNIGRSFCNYLLLIKTSFNFENFHRNEVYYGCKPNNSLLCLCSNETR